MERKKFLYEILIEEFGNRGINETLLPPIIEKNLNPKLPVRTYQKTAFKHFIKYWENKFAGKPSKHQILFLMATGSGKTLMMAGLILYLYEKGYRNFLFFVNSTNIIDKTRDNFLNDASIKYLFNKSISFVGKAINLKEVNNFQNVGDDSINIIFSTIQGLHTKLNNPQENSLTYEDFQEQKIVLISDEAHHINVETKAGFRVNTNGEVKVSNKIAKEKKEEIVSWENTVKRIFNINSQNVLLEFTATINFSNHFILDKYAERLIYDYPLKQFRLDGYSKDVIVMQTDASSLFNRALQAVLLSQYRRKIFEKNKLLVKPVILFKSKTIKESKIFQEEFTKGIKNLTSRKIAEIKSNTEKGVLKKFFKYLENNKISFENLVTEIQEDFSAEKSISVNSKEESEEKQLAVNNLEAPNNEYRIIFAVDKLNEGWDVLNLFDIVRLYDTRDTKNNQPGATTIREAQLIGRGARYCPFKINDSDDVCRRKFDHDIENEMRICEELYYHSTSDSRYIQELKSALVKTGIFDDKTIKRNLTIKKTFKKTKLFKTGLLFLNHQEKFSRKDIFGLPSSLHDTLYQTTLRTGFSLSDNLFAEKTKKIIERKEKIFYLKDFNKVVIRKALHKLHFYSFSNIKKHFPNLETLGEFISKDEYLGGIKINISGLAIQLEKLPIPDEQLIATIKVLEQIATSLSSKISEWKGSKKFKEYLIKDKISDKTLNFAADESSDKELSKPMSDPHKTSIYLDISKKSWHIFNDCYGTSEEKNFVKYMDKIYDQLREKYEEIYLLRNEHFFKLYNFDDGSPFEPDYVLFLHQKTEPKNFYYQVFIEPKGSYLEEKDAWKQKFLTSIRKEQQIEQLWEDRKCIVWGMPFYNKEKEELFDKKFWETF